MTGRAPSEPRVSVIVPAYFSQGTIAACLDALAAQTFRSFEVIVVNSSDETETARIVAERNPDVRFHQAPARLLPHAARNHGVGMARGELLVFTDPDCNADPRWLEVLVATADKRHPYVVGSIDLASPTWFNWAVHMAKFGEWLPGQAAGPVRLAPTANMCITREVWERVGPFEDRWFSSDSLFSWKATVAGMQPWFEPDAVVAHQHQATLGSFWSDRVSRGEDLAEVRVEFEKWPRSKLAMYAFAFPLRPPAMMVRAALDARRAGRMGRYLAVSPLLFLAWVGWFLGEARVHVRRAVPGR